MSSLVQHGRLSQSTPDATPVGELYAHIAGWLLVTACGGLDPYSIMVLLAPVSPPDPQTPSSRSATTQTVRDRPRLLCDLQRWS